LPTEEGEERGGGLRWGGGMEKRVEYPPNPDPEGFFYLKTEKGKVGRW